MKIPFLKTASEPAYFLCLQLQSLSRYDLRHLRSKKIRSKFYYRLSNKMLVIRSLNIFVVPGLVFCCSFYLLPDRRMLEPIIK